MNPNCELINLFNKLSNFKDLEDACVNYPEYKDSLIQLILADNEKYQLLIQDEDSLRWVIDTFPQHTSKIIKLIDDEKENNIIIKITDNSNFRDTEAQILFDRLNTFDELKKAIEMYPQYSNAMITLFLSAPNRLIYDTNDVGWILDKFPQHIDATLKLLPNNTSDLINDSLNEAFIEVGPTLINVPTRHYYYISKEKSSNYVGFITNRVYECVFGVITSDQGYAAFHLFRTNDTRALAQKIHDDFKNATNVKLHLYGGNLVNTFFPWKNKRDITTYAENNELLQGEQALKVMEKQFLNNKAQVPLQITKQNEEKFSSLIKECSKTIDDFFIIYDHKEIDSRLKNADLLAELPSNSYSELELKSKSQFKIKGIKDNSGYQNLADLVHAVSSIGLFQNKDDVTHYHTKLGLHIMANFDGAIKGIDKMGYENIKNIYYIEDVKNFKIPYKQEIESHQSLNKTDLINLKTK